MVVDNQKLHQICPGKDVPVPDAAVRLKRARLREDSCVRLHAVGYSVAFAHKQTRIARQHRFGQG
eukprot:7530814-Heterocapsa_arctica.AAC.1